MDRRTFLSWVGVGTLASSLPVVIAACTSSETPEASRDQETSDTSASAPPEANAEGFTEIGKLSDLEANGELTQKDFAGAPLLVILNPDDKTQAIAFKNQCTHQQCEVDWDQAGGSLDCPCHGSKFKPDGTVANGPAAEPLPTYEAKIEGDTVLVKAG